MAQYRFLADASIANQYIDAGTIQSTADAGGILPTNWQPSGAVEPLDTPALNAFYAVGPQLAPLVRPQWSTQFVALAATYWKQAGGFWALTGLGAGLPQIGV